MSNRFFVKAYNMHLYANKIFRTESLLGSMELKTCHDNILKNKKKSSVTNLMTTLFVA